MRMRSRLSGAPTPRRRRRRPDGLGQWHKALDHHIWFLRRAGIPEAVISKASAASLTRHRRVRALTVPPLAVLLYSRVLTYWRNDRRYLDGEGNPRALPRTGGRISFRSLVREALDEGDAEEVLTVLARHRAVSQDRSGNIHLIESALVPMGAQERAHALGYVLMAVEAAIDTCYATLRASGPTQYRGRVQRMAISEKFDSRYLGDYDKFTRETLSNFLDLHNVWLKAHEVKESKGQTRRRNLVGVNVNSVMRQL